MAGKKSKALSAAEQLVERQVASRVVDDDGWSRAMVERAILVFDDIERLPQYDEDNIRKRVADFLRFADRLEQGGIVAQAEPLARAFVARGYAWLEKHPAYAPFTSQLWNVEMIEQVIQWFADTTGKPLDRRGADEVGRRLRTFAAVIGTGAVETGDAETLALAFLDHVTAWVNRHPDVRATFVQER